MLMDEGQGDVSDGSVSLLPDDQFGQSFCRITVFIDRNAVALGAVDEGKFRGEEAIDEHNQIYNFSIERDADNAIKYLKIHIEKGLEHALDLFQDQI